MSTTSGSIDVRSVSVGLPAELHRRRDGRIVTSGIRKFHLQPGPIVVGTTNIEGDGQDDLVNHGGVDKAVYVYPLEHVAAWRTEIGYDGGESPFGENLSIAGITEVSASIGDIWTWGPVRLQISQPRWPCSKLALRTGHMGMIKQFVASQRSGWYLRVLTPGTVDSREPVRVDAIDPRGLTVREAFAANVNRNALDSTTRDRVLSHPFLSDAWKAMVSA